MSKAEKLIMLMVIWVLAIFISSIGMGTTYTALHSKGLEAMLFMTIPLTVLPIVVGVVLMYVISFHVETKIKLVKKDVR